jgi:hypothetical protein
MTTRAAAFVFLWILPVQPASAQLSDDLQISGYFQAMPEWIRQTAMGDILGVDFSGLHDNALYRNLDRLHPNREQIERELAEQEKTLFNLDETLYLYDVTSTYFEGLALRNPQAKRGYSRDKRPDCKQVVVGLVLGTAGGFIGLYYGGLSPVRDPSKVELSGLAMAGRRRLVHRSARPAAAGARHLLRGALGA